jgi:ubiquinone/menaquinone biosynthesis C-methylase UbiE
MKIYLGCGPKILDGYVNCDCRDLPGVNKVFDLEKDFPYPFTDGSVDHVFTEETLEHLSWRLIDKIFVEVHRILKIGGTILFQVPDIGEMCKNYVLNEICDCVPQKAKKTSDYKALPNCEKCKGKGKIHPQRWLLAFSGAQKHPWDVHKSIFTKEIMSEKLIKAGFKEIKFENNPYKIVVSAKKP